MWESKFIRDAYSSTSRVIAFKIALNKYVKRAVITILMTEEKQKFLTFGRIEQVGPVSWTVPKKIPANTLPKTEELSWNYPTRLSLAI